MFSYCLNMLILGVEKNYLNIDVLNLYRKIIKNIKFFVYRDFQYTNTSKYIIPYRPKPRHKLDHRLIVLII